MRMAVLQLKSSRLLCSGLKRLLSTHLSRTDTATVCIPKVICILAKWISPKRRPSLLRSIVNGIDDGLCIAARAFSNVQPAIWNKIKEQLQVSNAAIEATKIRCGMPCAYPPRTHGLWRIKYSIWSCSEIWRCFPFKSWKRNEGWSNPLGCMAHA